MGDGIFRLDKLSRKSPTMGLRPIVAVLGLLAVQPFPALAGTGPQVVVIVRHAEKSDTPKDDVALSDRGRARAEALASALDAAGVETIITTERRRSRETAAPLALRVHVTPVVVPTAGDVDVHATAVAEAVRNGGDVVLVVGHSNTVPAIIRALGGPMIPDICDGQYALLFTLRVESGKPARLIRSTYGAPDPESGECNAMKVGP
jgi:broad specificity phosphatase PhoE